MTIDIHQPKLKAFIQERMAAGGYATAEEVLLEALFRHVGPAPRPRTTLVAALKSAKGLGEGVDFTRDKSPTRDVAL